MPKGESFSGAFLLVVCLSWTTQVLAAPFQEDSDEFPIIMMSAELGTHANMAAMGVDYVHTYNYPTAQYFNSAAANGLRVMAGLHGEIWAGHPFKMRNNFCAILISFRLPGWYDGCMG